MSADSAAVAPPAQSPPLLWPPPLADGAAAPTAPSAAVARIRSSSGRRGPGHSRGTMLVDSAASVDMAHDPAMFDENTLEPCYDDRVIEIANGAPLPATHTGTLQLEVRDESGAWRAFQRPGAWLVPGLRMNLLSVRASRQLGWRAPDFDRLIVHGPHGECFPILDAFPDYVLASRIPGGTRAGEHEPVAAAAAAAVGEDGLL